MNRSQSVSIRRNPKQSKQVWPVLLFIAVASLATIPIAASAQSAGLPVEWYGVHAAPPVPIEGNSILLKVNAVGSAPPITVVNQVLSINDHVVDLTVYLDHGSTFPSPQIYYVNQQVPGLSPSSYLIRVFLMERLPGSVSFVGPNLLYSSQLAVVARANIAQAIEYYNQQRDHYFMTTDSDEIAKLDSGVIVGWRRTGEHLLVYNAPVPEDTSLRPVCRYYGLPEAGIDSHFFSAFSTECAAVAVKWPDIWILESPSAFWTNIPGQENADPPSSDPGTCPVGTVPAYRLYNNRPDANHRYTTSLAIRQLMIGENWIPEGLGASAVAMCVLASTANTSRAFG